jgi:hypothetical protein
MVHDLQNNYITPGIEQSQVLVLLGDPEPNRVFGIVDSNEDEKEFKRILVYALGSCWQTTLRGMDDVWLIIYFGSSVSGCR